MIFPCPALNGNGTFNDPSMDFSEIPMIHRWDSMGPQPGCTQLLLKVPFIINMVQKKKFTRISLIKSEKCFGAAT